MVKPVVQIRIAWLWKCTKCNHENVHYGNRVKPEFVDGVDFADENEEQLPLEAFVCAPTVVFCSACEEEHHVKSD